MLDQRRLFRMHVEAVWNVRLPHYLDNENLLLPDSHQPGWRLLVAELADSRILIWRNEEERAQGATLLAELLEAFAEPTSNKSSSVISHELALALTATPRLSLAEAATVARPLTSKDTAIIEAYDPGMSGYYFQEQCQPVFGVIVADQLVSVAHSSRRTLEACELGIDTAEHARRKGYGLSTTILWSAGVLQAGLTPLYSLSLENEPSLRLAYAAGYRLFAREATII